MSFRWEWMSARAPRHVQLVLWSTALVVAPACHRSAPPLPPEHVEPPAVEALDSEEPPQAPPIAKRAVPMRRGPTLELEPVAGLLAPFSAQLSARDAEQAPLLVAQVKPLWIAIDDNPPRAWDGIALSLGQLLTEDEELSPGHHRVLAYSKSSSALSYEIIPVSVETVPSGSAQVAPCALLSPFGTFNGQHSTRAIEVVVVPTDVAVDRIEVSAEAPDYLALAQLKPGETAILEGAPDGDVQILATCFQAGQALAHSERTITLNSDAKEEPPK